MQAPKMLHMWRCGICDFETFYPSQGHKFIEGARMCLSCETRNAVPVQSFSPPEYFKYLYPEGTVLPNQKPGEALYSAGLVLKGIREAVGISQYEFADMMNYGRSQVSNVEAGHTIGSRKYIEEATKTLGAAIKRREYKPANRHRIEPSDDFAAKLQLLIDKVDQLIKLLAGENAVGGTENDF